MKRGFRAGILFVILIFVFLTVPTLRKISHLRQALRKNDLYHQEFELPVGDSSQINNKLEDLIDRSDLAKESIDLRARRQDRLILYEYEMQLSGTKEHLVKFVDTVSRLEGIELRYLEIEPGQQVSKLFMRAVFIGESR